MTANVPAIILGIKNLRPGGLAKAGTCVRQNDGSRQLNLMDDYQLSLTKC